MKFSEQELGDIIKFALEGDFSIFYKDEFEEVLKKRIGSGFGKYIIDLEKVDYIDSMGIGVLVEAGTAASKENHKVIIVNPTAKVRQVIEMAKLHKILEISESEEVAVDLLS